MLHPSSNVLLCWEYQHGKRKPFFTFLTNVKCSQPLKATIAAVIPEWTILEYDLACAEGNHNFILV